MKAVTVIVHRRGREREVTRTLPELIEYFRYTLEVGKSWEKERGNSKISMNPKSVETLVKNLNNAEDNAARNGCGSNFYTVG